MCLCKIIVYTCIILLSGCRSAEINIYGLSEFVQYQISRELYSISKDEAKKQIKEDPSINYEEYEIQKSRLIKPCRNTKYDLLLFNNFKIDSKGRLKFKIPDNEFNNNFLKIKNKSSLDIDTSINYNNIKFNLEYNYINLDIKYGLDNGETSWILFLKWDF